MEAAHSQGSYDTGNRPSTTDRVTLLRRLFPRGIPPLWCPPLTHYDDTGAIDAVRIAAHLRHLSPHARGLLVPGSTGDGWELSIRETRRLLAVAVEQARTLNLQLLIGALKPDPLDAIQFIRDTVESLKAKFKIDDPAEALAQARVCGFAVCPPRGGDLSQSQIVAGLASILDLGLPTAIYQLPQVTENELSPEAAAELASRFPNFVLFKDTSGTDRVALEGRGLGGVFVVRGAEGNYPRWLKAAGGPYDGFLLGSANCFAAQYHQLIHELSASRIEAARQLGERITAAVSEVTGLVAGFPHGNAFANANKAMDHFFAHGPSAAQVPPPRLHAGVRLTKEIIVGAGEVLSRYNFMPSQGYLG